MRKPLLLLTLLTLFAVPVWAQSAKVYQADNFDIPNSVHVETPTPKPAPKTPKKLTTSQNFSYNPAPGSLIHPTSQQINPSLGGFTTGDANVDNFIVDSGRRNSVDPLLLYAIMHQESTFKARAMSSKGARGLMQLMPFTAVRFGVSNIWDPRQNIEGGARYMRFLLDMFSGDIQLALAGYNAGEGAVLKYGYQIPPYSETQEYVRRIGRRYSLIRDPEAAANASRLTKEEVAALKLKESAPLNVYER